MITNLLDLMRFVDGYHDYLASQGTRFDDLGCSIVPAKAFLNEEPDAMVPHKDRKGPLVSNPSRTVICSFTCDQRIYPRLEQAFSDADEYRGFMGIVAADLTVTARKVIQVPFIMLHCTS